jgi:hypothetical protein
MSTTLNPFRRSTRIAALPPADSESPTPHTDSVNKSFPTGYEIPKGVVFDPPNNAAPPVPTSTSTGAAALPVPVDVPGPGVATVAVSDKNEEEEEEVVEVKHETTRLTEHQRMAQERFRSMPGGDMAKFLFEMDDILSKLGFRRCCVLIHLVEQHVFGSGGPLASSPFLNLGMTAAFTRVHQELNKPDADPDPREFVKRPKAGTGERPRHFKNGESVKRLTENLSHAVIPVEASGCTWDEIAQTQVNGKGIVQPVDLPFVGELLHALKSLQDYYKRCGEIEASKKMKKEGKTDILLKSGAVVLGAARGNGKRKKKVVMRNTEQGGMVTDKTRQVADQLRAARRKDKVLDVESGGSSVSYSSDDSNPSSEVAEKPAKKPKTDQRKGKPRQSLAAAIANILQSPQSQQQSQQSQRTVEVIEAEKALAALQLEVARAQAEAARQQAEAARVQMELLSRQK